MEGVKADQNLNAKGVNSAPPKKGAKRLMLFWIGGEGRWTCNSIPSGGIAGKYNPTASRKETNSSLA